VEQAARLGWLEEFASGNVKGFSPVGDFKAGWKSAFGKNDDPGLLGRIPYTVCINLGRKIIVPDCVIESISIPLDKERTKEGNLVRAEVQMDIQTKVMLNRADIAGTWKGTDKSIYKAQGSDW